MAVTAVSQELGPGGRRRRRCSPVTRRRWRAHLKITDLDAGESRAPQKLLAG